MLCAVNLAKEFSQMSHLSRLAYLPTVVSMLWLNFDPVRARISDVFPTPESPSKSILYVTSHSSPSSVMTSACLLLSIDTPQ